MSSKARRDGRRAYFDGGDPEIECPYRSAQKRYERACWIEGFEEERSSELRIAKEDRDKNKLYTESNSTNPDQLIGRIDTLEKALIKIYDEPNNTDKIIDIAYDALNGQV